MLNKYVETWSASSVITIPTLHNCNTKKTFSLLPCKKQEQFARYMPIYPFMSVHDLYGWWWHPMLISLVPHDGPCFLSNSGSLWPRQCDVDGSAMLLTEPPEELGCSANRLPCNNGLAVALVHEHDMAMRTKSIAATSFLIAGQTELLCAV